MSKLFNDSHLRCILQIPDQAVFVMQTSAGTISPHEKWGKPSNNMICSRVIPKLHQLGFHLMLGSTMLGKCYFCGKVSASHMFVFQYNHR